MAKERSAALFDLLWPHCDTIPFTRVRRYGGTKSYIDRAYGSCLFCAAFHTTAACVIDFVNVHGIQHHNPIVIHTSPWTTPRCPPPRPPRCALWNRRDVQLYKRTMNDLTTCLMVPYTFSDVEATYSKLQAQMLTAMQRVNDTPQNDAEEKPSATD